ncbi:MAG: pentapeptide repeat-containing protein [Verrucomicrobiales bacterium]
MKTLNAPALLFVLTALPVTAELATDFETGFRTGTITVNGETYEIGPGVDLQEANLQGAALWGANLEGANLWRVDLSGADLTDAHLTDAHPTLAQVQDARVDSIVVARDPQSGVVTLCFDLQKSDDFISWVAYEGGTWSDAPDGEFKVSLPLGPGKEWLRMGMKK